MGAVKNYFLELICACSEHEFGQEVLQWAIFEGHVRLTLRRDDDLRTLTQKHDRLIELYHARVQTPAQAA